MEADASFLLDNLKSNRKRYTDLLLDKMRAPDGGYEEGFTVPGLSTSPKRVSKPDINLERNNPLSLHNEVPSLSEILEYFSDDPIEPLDRVVCFGGAQEDYSPGC